MKIGGWRFLLITFSMSCVYAGSWERVESLRGTNVVSMAISFQGYIYASVDPNIFGTGGLGHSPLYRSTDKGQTWHYMDSPLYPFSFLLASKTENFLLGAVAGNLYRSTNGGIDWTISSPANPPEYINSMVLANNGTVFLSTYQGGVYRSTDFGATWTPCSRAFSQTEFVSIAANGVLIAGATPGIYWSTNDGASWQKIGLGETTVTHGLVTRNGTILAATYTGAYRSIDTGRTWTSLTFPAFQIGKYAEAVDGSIYLGVHNPECTFRSTDDGKTWTEISFDTGRSVIHVLVGDTLNGQFVAAGASGIHQSTDGGNHWTQLPLTAFKTNTIYSGNNGKLYVATSIGSFRAQTKDLLWKPMDGFFSTPKKFAQNNNRLYAVAGDLRMSSDDGTTWSSVDYFQYYSVNILDLAQKLPSGLFVSSTRAISPCPCAWGIYRSQDSGETWSKANGSIFQKLAAAPGGTLIAGSDSLFRSTDNGSTWLNQSSGIIANPITALVAFKNGFFFAATKLKDVYLSTDDGITWTKSFYNGGIVQEFNVNSIGHIFAATDSGVFRSVDTGKSWISMNDGLPSLLITSISIDEQGYAYCATHMDGIFRSTNSTTAVIEGKKNFPLHFSLFQNYPNPFNPTTQIEYQLSQRNFVTLRIYDMLGRETATLVNEQKDAGSYSVLWNASQFVSGIYFSRMNAGNYTAVRKLVLLK